MKALSNLGRAALADLHHFPYRTSLLDGRTLRSLEGRRLVEVRTVDTRTGPAPRAFLTEAGHQLASDLLDEEG